MTAPPRIFAPERRRAARQRIAARQARPGAARFVLEDLVEDVLERLTFLRHEPGKALVIGDWTGVLAAELERRGGTVTSADAFTLDEEQPFPVSGLDLIVSLGTLDTVNDLPGAMIHIREALAPGGRAIASFVGAGSLANLRRAMLTADGERPAARLHPMVDIRAAAALLQRAGWAEPVADSRTIRVSYRSLDRLVADLRDQGLGNVLASAAAPLGKAALERARAAFLEGADAGGRVVESLEIMTLSGRRSLRGS
uniref:methyltransferase domain-containing protein n=1 Tax=Altererythrobacter segetis TaxID=1104773 RepID=UPI00140B4C1E|nr:methyltransferase domain-containing protein [Altererythrobacter segetis]